MCLGWPCLKKQKRPDQATGLVSVSGKKVAKTNEVAENIPMSCPVADHLYSFVLPVDLPMGENEKDFSRVQVALHDSDGKILDQSHKVEIFATGKLGGLTGGLLHTSDFRKVKSREEVQILAVEHVDEKLEKKRTSSILYYCCFQCKHGHPAPRKGFV